MPIKNVIKRKPATNAATSSSAGRNRSEPPSIGATLSSLRQRAGLSLEGLARQSGVSKSMLSQIERGKTNPTVAVVWRLATALGVEVAELLSAGTRSEGPSIQLVSEAHTPAMRSADGKYELRILSPVELAGRFEWYELELQPGGALRSEPHEQGAREHLTVLSGRVSIGIDQQSQVVSERQTARYCADVPHLIANEGKTVSVALLVVIHAAS